MITLNVIEKYLKFGWSVIPLHPKDKQAYCPWKYYQTYLPQLSSWEQWLSDEPNLNIGVVCGNVSNNLIGLDIDGDTAYKKFLDICKDDMPDTVRFKTGNGHRYFFKGNIKTKHFSFEDHSISFLGENSYSVIPPSIHPSGRLYEWYNCCSIGEVAIADLPQSLINYYNQTTKQLKVNNAKETNITKGQRNLVLFNVGSNLIRNKLSKEIVHKTLGFMNNSFCNPPLEEYEIESIVNSVERYRN